MEIEQKQKEEGDQVTLSLQVLYLVDIEEDVSMNLCKAEEHTQDLEVAIIFDVLVSSLSASLAAFEAVIIVLELSHYFG